ncbi:bifunctional diguanylate cyclase/phosphodiesterase [Quadrisphaera sp. INWT6]|uniref:putative bifunctional diguanylate cyclase/phosphodiesterase n=1 Tax=Quadrisphaera sp. INWT6 TaxID=2596917 RepID=UPI00189283A9|nr:GGDEF domain-containing phosphodiesterase [Quadrisphaera sp. INWT6]MBF5080796.1 EAL domain-containing protein [Quadrisphaera sp. INWT6]
MSSTLGAGVYAVVLLSALTMLVLRVRAMPADRSAWALLAAGATVLGTCQLLLITAAAASSASSGSAAGPSAELAIATFRDHPTLGAVGLAAYPLLYAGQMRLLKQHVNGVMPSAWLDGLLAGLLLLAGACAYATPVLDAHFGLGLAGSLALVMRPLLDLLLTLFAAANWSLVGRDADRRLVALTAAFAALTFADTLGVARVTGVLTAQLGPGLTPGIDLADLDAAANLTANSLRLLVLLLLASTATAVAVRRSAQMVRWSSIAGPAIVLIGSLALLWHNEVTPLGGAAVAVTLLALAGVGVKGVLLFREVLALADSRRLALSDDLTGLANRRAFNLALAEAVQTSEATQPGSDGSDAAVALLLIDLNGFKAVNDRYGHTVGDALLRWTAARLAAVVPAGGVLARLGGDEFAVLLTGPAAGSADYVARAGAAAIAAPTAAVARFPQTTPTLAATAHPGAGDGGLTSLAEPVWPDQLPLSAALTASIGVAAVGASRGRSSASSHFSGVPGSGPGVQTVESLGEELLRRADVAMYRAKAAGGAGGVRLFDPEDDRAAQERVVLLEELRQALAREDNALSGAPSATEGSSAEGADSAGHEQVVVHYQPQVDLRTGETTGVEALVRWHHPRLGLLAPSAFVDLAEQHGLVAALTTRVLRTAAADAVSWHSSGHPLRVAVNLSTSCLVNPALLPLIDDVLAQTGIDPGLLVMEVTETTLMSDPEQALATAHGIRQRGVQLSIDDYGTGYSSLAYLASLPATELKLDRSFTSRLTGDSATAAIVASTVDLAHRLGLRLLAEGVEDEETLQALVAAGCDESQGYWHARPAPAAAVTRWLREGRRGADHLPVLGLERS